VGGRRLGHATDSAPSIPDPAAKFCREWPYAVSAEVRRRPDGGTSAGQGVARVDEVADEHAGVTGGEVAALFDAASLFGEVAVLHLLAEPARIVAAAQVVQPRFFVDAFGDLREDDEVLRTEVVPALRATEVEAAVAHVADRVLALVSQALRAPPAQADGERRLVAARKPRDGPARFVLQPFGPLQS